MRVVEKTKEIWSKEKENTRKNFLKLILAVPFWIILGALVLIGIGVGRTIFLSGSRPDQHVAEIWQSNSEVSFRHMSVYAGGIRASGDTSPMTYIAGGKSIHYADIPIIRKSLQSTADTGSGASGKNLGYVEGKLRGWEDCYSSTVMATVSAMEFKDGKEVTTGTANAQLVAVGGNYKAFHPYRYMSGGFLPEIPVDMNQIVINDVLAWKFYRSYDVVGNKIIINNQMFTIIGVVEEKNTKVAELAGEQENRAFIYFGALGTIFGSKNSSGSDEFGDYGNYGDYGGYGDYGNYGDYSGSGSGTTDSEADYAIQCYEAMLPELVKGVAVTDFKNALPSYSLTNPQVYVSNDTGRFGVFRILDTMFPLGETDRARMGYEFPYWERAAQLTEDRLFYDYMITAFGILLLFAGIVMIALKFRAKKTVDPDDLKADDIEDMNEKAEKELILKA
ncbi:ABC transporter permease [Butyrivibrio sp. AE2032]|uniref:ABC transporter permease n=1 Tax=Butyrivibrio sp. AE2032 TaxID=1458463 RepID=UPI000551B802|nr:ABC transporter permease [Butyrivibrio sp. AE2032]